MRAAPETTRRWWSGCGPLPSGIPAGAMAGPGQSFVGKERGPTTSGASADRLRLWKQEGLWVRPRRKKRQVRTGRSVPCRATHPNHVWTYDFLHDNCWSGTRLKLLRVEDEFTRECLSIEVATSLPASKVLGVLSGLFCAQGAPRLLRRVDGPVFIAVVLKDWLAKQGTGTLYIEPGSAWQNGQGESFNGKFRDECLNAEVFVSVAEARVRVEAYRRHYSAL